MNKKDSLTSQKLEKNVEKKKGKKKKALCKKNVIAIKNRNPLSAQKLEVFKFTCMTLRFSDEVIEKSFLEDDGE